MAYVGPYLVYVGISTFEASGALGLDYFTFCTLKGIAAAILLLMYRGQYPRFSTNGFPLSIVAGVVGLGIWIGLDQLQMLVPQFQQLAGWVFGAKRAGFDPTASETLASRLFLCVRLAELVVIVPLAEEIFWRGFVARYLIAEDFCRVPEGQMTTLSFVVVTFGFATVHPEFLAAIGWSLLINWVYLKTRNLWACILMHAVTNGSLAVYILVTGCWYLW